MFVESIFQRKSIDFTKKWMISCRAIKISPKMNVTRLNLRLDSKQPTKTLDRWRELYNFLWKILLYVQVVIIVILHGF